MDEVKELVYYWGKEDLGLRGDHSWDRKLTVKHLVELSKHCFLTVQLFSEIGSYSLQLYIGSRELNFEVFFIESMHFKNNMSGNLLIILFSIILLLL